MTDLIFDKGLPHSPDCERLILGACMIQERIVPQVLACLQPDDFHLESHRRIFSHINALYEAGTPVERVTLAVALRDSSWLDSVGGMAYLVSLDDGLPEISHLDAYIRVVQDKAILRRAIFACQKAIDECLTSAASTPEILARLSKLTADLQSAQNSQMDAKRARDIVNELGGPHKLFTNQHVRNIPTPWSRLNNLNGGFELGSMVVIGGRPSQGKSVLASQIATEPALTGHGSCMLFSIEMSTPQVLYRMISARSGIPHSVIRSGRMDQDQTARAQTAAAEICECDSGDEILIADKPNTIPAIRAAILRARTKTPLRVVVVDYLQLMEVVSIRKGRNLSQELGEISRALKVLAIEFDLVMVVCSQLSRDGSKQGREPDLHDLRDSGAIESDADVVIFPHEENEGIGDRNASAKVNLLVRKWRNGRLGQIPLVFEKSCVRFVEA